LIFPDGVFTHSITDVKDEDPGIEIVLLSRDEDPEIANGILRIIESMKVVHWREISGIIKQYYTVSFERLFKIMQDLIRAGKVVELPCRFFTAPEYLMRILSDDSSEELMEFINIVQRKAKELDLTRCSPSLVNPVNFVKIKIEKGGNHRKVIIQIIRYGNK